MTAKLISFAETSSKRNLKKSEICNKVVDNAYFCIMILYNTTYQMPVEDARNFVIWVTQVMIPQLQESKYVSSPRLLHILSHKEEDSECFALQMEMESTATLHAWFVKQGQKLNTEMLKAFDNKVVGFSTMMEVISYD